jgi:FkbM family methyltransferase
LGKEKYNIQDVCLYLNPTSTIENNIISTQYHDKHIIDLINESLNDGDYFIDIGANIGYFSLFAAVKRNASVLSFEPSSRELKDFYLNMKANIPYSKNIVIFPYGLSDNNEKRFLHINHIENPGKNSLLKRHQTNSTERIDTFRGEVLIPQHCFSKIKLIKVDVEGYEFKVLKGLRSVLKMITDAYIVIEITPYLLKNTGDSAAEIYDLLEVLNFHPITNKRHEDLTQYDEIFYHK